MHASFLFDESIVYYSCFTRSDTPPQNPIFIGCQSTNYARNHHQTAPHIPHTHTPKPIAPAETICSFTSKSSHQLCVSRSENKTVITSMGRTRALSTHTLSCSHARRHGARARALAVLHVWLLVFLLLITTCGAHATRAHPAFMRSYLIRCRRQPGTRCPRERASRVHYTHRCCCQRTHVAGTHCCAVGWPNIISYSCVYSAVQQHNTHAYIEQHIFMLHNTT